MEKKADTKETDIYTKLTAQIPEAAIEKTYTKKTKKGYDTTGYKYQYIVERLNEVFGFDGWSYSYKILKEETGVRGQYDTPYYEVTAEVTIVIDRYSNQKVSIGGHTARTFADALKGAITNGFKKCAAFFGIGQEAYKGTIDDDNIPLEIKENQETKKTITIPKPLPKEQDKEETPEAKIKRKRKEIGNMLVDVCDGNIKEAQLMLAINTRFLDKEKDTMVEGKTSAKALTDKQVTISYPKIQKIFNEWQEKQKG